MSSMAMRTHAAREVVRIAAAVEHAHEPVQRGVRIGAAHRLVQRRDLVVELLAALVEAAPRRRSPLRATCASVMVARPSRAVRQIRGELEHAQRAARIAVAARARAAPAPRRSMLQSRLPSPRSAIRRAPAAAAARCPRLPSERSTYTRARDSSALMTSNDGFSVVAPMKVSVPSSTYGRNVSCCALLKRCTSSRNSTVGRPRSRARRARLLDRRADVLHAGHHRRELR